MIVSAACSLPSSATIVCSRTSRTPLATSSTFGCWSAGYQSFEGSTRLHPKVYEGTSFARSTGSATWRPRWASAARCGRPISRGCMNPRTTISRDPKIHPRIAVWVQGRVR